MQTDEIQIIVEGDTRKERPTRTYRLGLRFLIVRLDQGLQY